METNVVDERRQFVLDFASGHWSMSELCERARHQPRLTSVRIAPATTSRRSCSRRDGSSDGTPRAGAGAREATPGHDLAGTQHGQRDPRAAWRAAQEPTTSQVEPSGRGPAPDRAAQPGVASRFPRAVQHRRRPVLLSADGHGPLQPNPLLCHALPSVKGQDVRPVFCRLFRAIGLPDAIRTDNGAPFASTGIHGLSQLNVWWMHLGMRPDFC
jgi:hypothetical protein